MRPFGMEATALQENEKAAVKRAPEEITIERPKEKRMQDEEDEEVYCGDMSQIKLTRDLKLKFKQLGEDVADDNDEPEDDGAGDRYVPPSRREGGQDRFRESEQRQKEECTIRVTNLSEQAREDDLTNLFKQAGKIHRIYLAKDRETNHSKGFAFITYQKREEAAKAIQTLHRHGYDNLLLNVEWAKPSNRDQNK
eukprot:GHVT01073697.1.p2 GENE.GHVT01073697.1~~GHVT01073697.1.p2  ORF type:complete len:195 (-),score=48.81 GHVT01073697.1:869-1453(-)